MHVVLLGQLQLPGSRHPHIDPAILQLDRAVEVSFLAAHGVGGAQQADRRPLQLCQAGRDREIRARAAASKRFNGLLRPERRSRSRQERLDQVPTFELGDEFLQLLVGPGELLQLGEREAAAETDRRRSASVFRELERARVEVVRLLHGERRSCAVARRQEVLDRLRRLAPLAPVVREDPGELRRIGDRCLDEAGRGGVQIAPERPRESGVRDVADQHVLERELHVAFHLALRVPAHEATRLERL